MRATLASQCGGCQAVHPLGSQRLLGGTPQQGPASRYLRAKTTQKPQAK